MPCDSLTAILDWSSPLVEGAQTGIVAWVAFRLRGTSEAARWTSQVSEANFVALHQLLGRSGSPQAALARKKSSTKGTTSTSRGEQLE